MNAMLAWTMTVAVVFNSNHNHSHEFICICICIWITSSTCTVHWCVPKSTELDWSFLFALIRSVCSVYLFISLFLSPPSMCLWVFWGVCACLKNQHWILTRKCVIYLLVNSMRSICYLCSCARIIHTFRWGFSKLYFNENCSWMQREIKHKKDLHPNWREI